MIIKNLDKINISKKDFIYHAGTKIEDNLLLSNGGRVLNITSTGGDFLSIRNNILSLLRKINWKGGFFRKDIGWRVIKKL